MTDSRDRWIDRVTDDKDEKDSYKVPTDADRMERNYDRGIYGDERGGQTPKRPVRRKP